MDTKDFIMLALGAYGTGLSTWLAVASWRDKRRVLNVEAGFGAPFPATSFQLVMTITVSNPGHKSVTVNSVGYRLPDRSELLLIDPGPQVRFPHTLSEGTSCIAIIPAGDMLNTLRARGYEGTVSVDPFAKDALGKQYVGKPYKIDMNIRP
jgi:hypothetical protein